MSKQIDITSEEYREYHYGNGAVFRVPSPVQLHVITDDAGATHRVIGQDGVTYRPERGWIAISWKPKDGAPPFVA